jgi:hypothetical protein
VVLVLEVSIKLPTQTAARAEVGDESVAQILGGEIVQRCGCYQASSDRGNVVSSRQLARPGANHILPRPRHHANALPN